MKGENAERGDFQQIESWAWDEESHDCHLKKHSKGDALWKMGSYRGYYLEFTKPTQ